MNDEATCAHCGGRLTWAGETFEHAWLDPAPPQPDLRVAAHEPWPYTVAHQLWRNAGRDTERPKTLEWDGEEFKQAHPGSRRDRALAWLRETFSR